MKVERRIIRATLVLVASALAACAMSPGTDGETHFVCGTDADCVAYGMVGPCVAGECAAGNSGLADSSTAGDSGRRVDAVTTECALETIQTPFPNVGFNGSALALPAFCGTLTFPDRCPEGPAEALQTYVCGPESTPPPLARSSGVQAAHRAIGCGFEFIYVYAVASDWIHVFSLSTGELVGAAYRTDQPIGPCKTSTYVAGTIPDCPEARRYFCVPPNELAADAGAYTGCRAPAEPGCATCCIDHPDGNHCTMVTETVTSDVPGTCAPACRPCAPCSLAEEQALRALPDRPECDCALPPGVDPCQSPTSCECWCEQITGLKEACPGVR
jgi:hypothetical protein